MNAKALEWFIRIFAAIGGSFMLYEFFKVLGAFSREW